MTVVPSSPQNVEVKKEPDAMEDALPLPGSEEAPQEATSKAAARANMRHQVAIPPGHTYVPLGQHVPPAEPARTYPFTLDSFQSTAIACIERNESVLVSAHTSAGKTVVAEYAIATSLRNKQRVVYTSPIKALSNQKYRDLLEVFGDCGLMTGDVTINPDASCMVMTTEILRSMLYRGSEIMREVAWVVFDEVHYMRDKERGVVWEETLILLPDTVRFVFLSATIPNALQFAEWISAVHHQVCHVVYTDFRPTPLQHYLFPEGGSGIFLVVDEAGQFREANFRKALGALATSAPNGSKGKKARRKSGGAPGEDGESDLRKLVRMLHDREYHPVIVFSFSKREVERNAMQLSKLTFTTEAERENVDLIFRSAIGQLREEDQALPQIANMLPLLRRGIGIHHSGLLPILKEVIELLFQEGLLKVLFATETFSIGLNMPARTVVFTSLRKFDGKSQRWITSGEFIQMSGRAGRRGLDARGIVVLMLGEEMEPDVCKGMLTGEADRLNSAFYQSYNMLLNLMRVEGVDPESLLAKSFFQFQSQAALPASVANVRRLEGEIADMVIPDEEALAERCELLATHAKVVRQALDIQMDPSNCLRFLQKGRLVVVSPEEFGGKTFGWGVVQDVVWVATPEQSAGGDRKGLNRKDAARQRREAENARQPGIRVALRGLPIVNSAKKRKNGQNGEASSANAEQRPVWQNCVVPLTCVHKMSSVLLNSANMRIDTPGGGDGSCPLDVAIAAVKKKYAGVVPELDPIADMGIKDPAFVKVLRRVQLVEEQLDAAPELAPEALAAFRRKQELRDELRQARRAVAENRDVVQMAELKCRCRVLRRLGYVSETGVIEVKGRIACEISAGDELMLTELVFGNAFASLTVAQTVALVSVFCFDERTPEAAAIRPDLAAALKQVHDVARYLARVSVECKLDVNEAEYVQSFRGDLMDVVFAWAEGAPFSQICKMTPVFEGSIIRMMRRLEELLRQLSNAAKNMGNLELEAKFAEGIQCIKRDIIFAASLYL